MASIPVTIIGVMTYSDLAVGGGPMPGGPEVTHPIAPGGQPSHPIAPGGPPLTIWGGGGVGDYIDAGFPAPQPPVGSRPPLTIWGPIGDYIDAGFPAPQPPLVVPLPPDSALKPTHPIYLGPPQVSHPIVIIPAPPEGGTKPPPTEGGWGYHPDYGWGYFPGGGGKPQPVPTPPTP